MLENNRLKDLLNFLIIERKVKNQEDMSAIIGINKSTFSELCNGKRELSERYIHRIHTKFPEINIEWLETGKGEMLLSESEPVVTPQVDTITMPREVFEQISKLTETILSQQRTIETLTSEIKKENAQDNASCVAAG